MTPNSNGLPSLPAILKSLVDRIRAIQWTNPSGTTEPAFERVEVGDVTDLKEVMGRLIINQSRICVLIYSGDDFSADRRGTDLHVTARHTVVCLIADRVLGDRVEAYMGNGSTPGAFELQRLVVGAVTGNLLENPKGAYCVPLQGNPIGIQSATEGLPGRAAIELDLEITGGEIRSSIGRTPIR